VTQIRGVTQLGMASRSALMLSVLDPGSNSGKAHSTPPPPQPMPRPEKITLTATIQCAFQIL
jgi:hypothetical protein